MENAEEILQSLDEFSKMKPKDIPRELEEYLCFVAKTGDPVYQWPLIKCLFREKLINVITDFYESCPTVDIPPCPNVAAFNYDAMKNFILEKLDTFAAAPFTVQRICELLTTPRKEYNRIDKYMRALEKNILVVSTREPGNRKSTENGENVVNGLESEHVPQEMINSDINVEVEMDESSSWQKTETTVPYAVSETNIILETQTVQASETVQDTYISESKSNETATCSSSISTVITSRPIGYIGYTPNITDLIIEPSNMAADSEPGPAPAENGEPASDNANISLFAMGSDASSEELKDEDRSTYKNVEQVESVFVKADCSESAYVRLEQMDADVAKKDDVEVGTSEAETSEVTVEPEPSVSQPEESDRPTEAPSDQQETSSSDEVPPEATTSDEPEPSVVQLEPESSSFERSDEPIVTEAEADTEAEAEGETETETTITSTDEVSTATPAEAETSSEDQVSESNLTEFVPLQPDEAPAEQSTEVEATKDGSTMEVDDIAPNTTETEAPDMDTN